MILKQRRQISSFRVLLLLICLQLLDVVVDGFTPNTPHRYKNGDLILSKPERRGHIITSSKNSIDVLSHSSSSSLNSNNDGLLHPLVLKSSSSFNDEGDNNNNDNDELFDSKTTLSLVGGQSALIIVAIIIAMFLGTPNYGLGPNISFVPQSILSGIIYTIPLGILAVVLDYVEKDIPALQEVTKATQRSILALLGGTWKPLLALGVSIGLGLAAGIGEEMLFRGIMQYELYERIGGTGVDGSTFLSLGLTSILFGAVHAVTPLYALLATAASIYFGYLYQIVTDFNLAVPITTHALYDVGALMYAHYTVSQLTDGERQLLLEWEPIGTPSKSMDNNDLPPL